MKSKSLPVIAVMMVIASMIGTIAGCKKNSEVTKNVIDTSKKNVVTPIIPVTLADSSMFVSTLDTVNQSSLGTTIYVLNAATGSLTTKYHYPYDSKTKWCSVSAGNGFLYDIRSNKINAINMTTGAVLWADTVNNAYVPVLHGDTFYGVYSVNAGTYGIYALDATKPTKTYLWKYQLTGGESLPYYLPSNNPLVRYYNGILYIIMDRVHLTALDAKTGMLKWTISNPSNPPNAPAYSLSSLNNGIIILGNSIIDAATGNPITTVTPPVIPPAFGAVTTQISWIEYVSKDQYFVRTYHFNTPLSRAFLSAVDRTTGVEKWHIDYGMGAGGIDTTNDIEQFWNNQLIIKHSAVLNSKYGTSVFDNFRMLDANKGSQILSFNDTSEGNVVESFIVNNTMYFDNNAISIGPFIYPTSNYLYAIDLPTGKQKWNNDKLLSGYSGSVFSCVYVAGKGYSAYIQ